jgi:hypothetical protein
MTNTATELGKLYDLTPETLADALADDYNVPFRVLILAVSQYSKEISRCAGLWDATADHFTIEGADQALIEMQRRFAEHYSPVGVIF